MVYIGILSNRGKRLNDDSAALAHAHRRCGIRPADSWEGVDNEFRRVLLEWFYSGDWLCRPDGAPDVSHGRIKEEDI